MLQRYFSDEGPHGERVTPLIVSNTGVGPAKVEAIELLWKGRAPRTPEELIAACCLSGVQAPAAAQVREQLDVSEVQGFMLRAGATLPLYSLAQSPATETVVQRLRATHRDIAMKACYCSVFDERWVSDLRTLHPQRVARCAVPEVPFRAQ